MDYSTPIKITPTVKKVFRNRGSVVGIFGGEFHRTGHRNSKFELMVEIPVSCGQIDKRRQMEFSVALGDDASIANDLWRVEYTSAILCQIWDNREVEEKILVAMMPHIKAMRRW